MLAGELAARAAAFGSEVGTRHAHLVERAALALAPIGVVVAAEVLPRRGRAELLAGGGAGIRRQRQNLLERKTHRSFGQSSKEACSDPIYSRREGLGRDPKSSF